MKKTINPELIVYPERPELNKLLVFCMQENIDWENIDFNDALEFSEEARRVSQIVLAKLSGNGLAYPVKNEDGSTSYNLMQPLYTEKKETKIDIERFYDLFSNKNLGKPLGRKTNKQQVISLIKKFLMENPQFDYDTIVEQTRLWIGNRIKEGAVDFVPKAENFIYKYDSRTGELVGSPLLDLLNDPIQVHKNQELL